MALNCRCSLIVLARSVILFGSGGTEEEEGGDLMMSCCGPSPSKGGP